MITYDYIEITCTECKEVFETYQEERRDHKNCNGDIMVEGFWKLNQNEGDN